MTGEPRCAVGVPNVGPFGDPLLLVELAVAAEEHGWDGFFVWDHLLYHDQRWDVADPVAVIAAVAARTARIRIGVLVNVLARRRIGEVARESVTVDLLSGGRLVVGAGLGSLAAEFTAFGESADARARAARLDESLGLLDALWSGEPVTVRGEYLTAVDVRMLPRPVQRPRIPVWCGGRWPARAPFRRAARWDGVMPTHAGYGLGQTMPPDELRAVVQYTRQHRTGDGPFDVILEGRTDGAAPGRGAGQVAPYLEAGLTWWIEGAGLVARQPAGRDEPGPPGAAGADPSPALIPLTAASPRRSTPAPPKSRHQQPSAPALHVPAVRRGRRELCGHQFRHAELVIGALQHGRRSSRAMCAHVRRPPHDPAVCRSSRYLPCCSLCRCITTSPECRRCVGTDSRRPMSFGRCAGLPTDIT